MRNHEIENLVLGKLALAKSQRLVAFLPGPQQLPGGYPHLAEQVLQFLLGDRVHVVVDRLEINARVPQRGVNLAAGRYRSASDR